MKEILHLLHVIHKIGIKNLFIGVFVVIFIYMIGTGIADVREGIYTKKEKRISDESQRIEQEFDSKYLNGVDLTEAQKQTLHEALGDLSKDIDKKEGIKKREYKLEEADYQIFIFSVTEGSTKSIYKAIRCKDIVNSYNIYKQNKDGQYQLYASGEN